MYDDSDVPPGKQEVKPKGQKKSKPKSIKASDAIAAMRADDQDFDIDLDEGFGPNPPSKKDTKATEPGDNNNSKKRKASDKTDALKSINAEQVFGLTKDLFQCFIVMNQGFDTLRKLLRCLDAAGFREVTMFINRNGITMVQQSGNKSSMSHAHLPARKKSEIFDPKTKTTITTWEETDIFCMYKFPENYEYVMTLDTKFFKANLEKNESLSFIAFAIADPPPTTQLILFRTSFEAGVTQIRTISGKECDDETKTQAKDIAETLSNGDSNDRIIKFQTSFLAAELSSIQTVSALVGIATNPVKNEFYIGSAGSNKHKKAHAYNTSILTKLPLMEDKETKNQLVVKQEKGDITSVIQKYSRELRAFAENFNSTNEETALKNCVGTEGGVVQVFLLKQLADVLKISEIAEWIYLQIERSDPEDGESAPGGALYIHAQIGIGTVVFIIAELQMENDDV